MQHGHNDAWTAEREQELRDLWKTGRSHGQIALALGNGITRNAVIGKVNRLKLPKRAAVGVTPKPKTRAGNSASAREQVKRAQSEEVVAPKPISTIVDEDVRVIPLTDLTDQTCRWPIGEPREAGFGFCGAPPMEGRRYCERHHRRSQMPKREMERNQELYVETRRRSAPTRVFGGA